MYPRQGLPSPPTDTGMLPFWPRLRTRRPLDGFRLLVAATALAVVLLLATWSEGLLESVARLIPGSPSGLTRGVWSVANVAVSVAVLGVLAAMTVDALRFRRFSLTCAAMACTLGVLGSWGLASIIGALAGDQSMRLLTGPASGSAGLPITAVFALLIGADLHRRRWWGLARLTVGAGVLCALALGSLNLPSATYAVLVGVTAGFAVRVVAGVVPARPSDEVIRFVLAGAGFELDHLQSEYRAAGRIRYSTVSPGIGDVRLTVVDPDRGGVPFVRRAWRLLRLRTAVVGKPALTLRRTAGTAGPDRGARHVRRCGRPAGAGAGRCGAGVGAAGANGGGTPLSAPRRFGGGGRGRRGVCRPTTAACRWAGPRRPDAPTELSLLPDGTPDSPTSPSRNRRPPSCSGAWTCQPVGRRGHQGRRRGRGAGAAVGLPVEPGLGGPTGRPAPAGDPAPRPLRRAVRRTPLLSDLRTAITGPDAASGIPGVPRLERLRPRTVISVVGATIAGYLLATQLSQVSIGSALRSADPRWLAVAVVGSAVTYLGSALALEAFVTDQTAAGPHRPGPVGRLVRGPGHPTGGRARRIEHPLPAEGRYPDPGRRRRSRGQGSRHRRHHPPAAGDLRLAQRRLRLPVDAAAQRQRPGHPGRHRGGPRPDRRCAPDPAIAAQRLEPLIRQILPQLDHDGQQSAAAGHRRGRRAGAQRRLRPGPGRVAPGLLDLARPAHPGRGLPGRFHPGISRADSGRAGRGRSRVGRRTDGYRSPGGRGHHRRAGLPGGHLLASGSVGLGRVRGSATTKPDLTRIHPGPPSVDQRFPVS